jgi:hypothetical protein
VDVAGAVGPAPSEARAGTGDGSLVVWSARTPADVDVNLAEWRWNNDFGRNEFLYEPAHSDYTIYKPTGEVVEHVRNSHDVDDPAPTRVMLPAGTYKVEAEALDCQSERIQALMTVVIEPGQTTAAYLDGDWKPQGGPEGTELARLPCGRPVGWLAPEAAYSTAQASR